MSPGENSVNDRDNLVCTDMSLQQTTEDRLISPKPFPKSVTFLFVIETSDVPTKNIHKDDRNQRVKGPLTLANAFAFF